MNTKQVGYDLWNNVLKSPRFVAAPMVDMSELSFRMLCRRYCAQLCYSPMLHSQQFVQDALYRKDTFSTCPEDRPLIVQFCANDPNTFVNAALMVSSQCDAIDLNLGCPQAIAKKGCYGAFLQDDWDLIHSIVQKAASELPVPVTCKMRILSGPLKKSVEYARMLESSGCSILTVHGRTREQKGHVTGLASWDVIKAIKENVKIPVIANGNILSFDDVKRCLQCTGVDAVMSAEALLHNPALFSSKNPPVWSVVEEYLQCAEKYDTPIRFVRCHLFKILYLCIHQDAKVRQILAEGSTFADFYSVCDVLKNLPQETAIVDFSGIKDESDNNNPDFQNNCEAANEIKAKLSLQSSIINNKTVCSWTKNMHSFTNSMLIEDMDCYNLTDLFSDSVKSMTTETHCESFHNQLHGISLNLNNTKSLKRELLPIWICHSRPRIVDDEKTRGCYSKYFSNSLEKTDSVVGEPFMSKKKLRKARRRDRVVAAMKEKRRVKRLRKKQKNSELQEKQPQVKKDISEPKMTKKQAKMLTRERLLKAQGSSPKVCINLSFAKLMDAKDLNRLSSQLRRLYGSNRQSDTPLHLYFCSLTPSDELYKICQIKNDGFSSYVVEMTDEPPEEIFNLEDLIYLSPDSENVLETLDLDKIYVIGGIIDGNAKKGVSLDYAKALKIKTARLPITEFLIKRSTNPGTTVLTVNQVFDVLLKYYETKNWIEALTGNVPPRKGYGTLPIINVTDKNLLARNDICDSRSNNCSNNLVESYS